MILWGLAASAPLAAAATPWWSGEWGLDPSRSDEPSTLIERAYVGPTATARDARAYSPDGGQVDLDDARRKLLYRLIGALGLSGRLSLGADGEAVTLGWGEGEPVHLTPGRKWTRVTPEEGERYRIRIQQDEDWLVVERKLTGATITETLLSPKESGELVIVVSIAGSELDTGLEFRRVYRAL